MKNFSNLFFLQLLLLLLISVNTLADTEPDNDTCDGESLVIESGTNQFTGTIENGPSDVGIDYYKISIPDDGNITITWETSQTGKEASFWVGSSCDNNDLYDGSTAANTHTTASLDVNGSDIVYLKVYNGEGKAYTITVNYDLTSAPGSQLNVTMTDSDDPVQINEAFYYHVQVINSGASESTNTTLTANIPSGLVFDANTTNDNTALGSCTQNAGVITCTHNSTIPAGVTQSINLYMYAPSSAGTVDFTVDISDDSNVTVSATEDTTITAEISNADNLCYIENTVASGLNADVNASCEKYGNYYYGQNCTAQIVILENNVSTDQITGLTVTKMYKPELHGTSATATSSLGTVLNSGAKSTLAIAEYPYYEEGFIVDVGSNLSDDHNFTITDTGSYDNQPLQGIGIYADYNISGTHHFGRVSACNGTGEPDVFTTIKDTSFTMVHDYFYPYSGDGNYYYNIPTQVTSRADSHFKVIALDDLNPGSLKDINTTLLLDVELVDGNTGGGDCASMTPLSNIVVDVALNKTNIANFVIDSTTIPDPSVTNPDRVFYEKAARNAYFRISYAADDSGNVITFEETSPGSGQFHLPGFEDYAGTLCKNEFWDYKYNPDGSVQSSDYHYKLVSVACANAGTSDPSGMTQNEVDICLKCIFGGEKVTNCSQDNFAIRPEAFKVTLKDQNQTNPVSQTTLGDNITGAMPLNIAADYNYDIGVVATNHYSQTSSPDYNTTDNSINLIWEPRNGHVVSGCNDVSNKTTAITFNGGSADLNITNAQVGEYRLNITDSSWTAVDQVVHSGANFYANGTNVTDCVPNSSVTQTVSANALNGCNVSTSHTNPQTTTLFNDYNVTYHPYKFDLNSADPITPSVGLNHNTSLSPTSFVYMADMSVSNDQNMSFHLNGSIAAVGYNGSALSDFVNNCYAKPLDLNISKSDTALLNTSGSSVMFQSRFYSLNNDGSTAENVDTNDTNTSQPLQIQTTQSYFTKDLNGTMSTVLNLNYNREVNQTVNPKRITYNDYSVECTNPSTDCTFNADLSTKTTQGELNLDQNITHYYGRTHAPRHIFTYNINQQDYIYYEAYCSGSGCDKTLLQGGSASNYSDDPRWFINTNHTQNYGTAGTVSQKGASYISVDTQPTGNHQDSVWITYDGTKGYPYKATMQNSASKWLIYNKYNPSATTNEFDVEFIGAGDWVGKHDTNTTTIKSGADRTNRRTMW